MGDALHAAGLGVQYLGFNFYDQSKRYISPELAGGIIRKLPSSVSAVGIFVNANKTLIDQVLYSAPVRLLQFHGDEEPSFVTQFKDYETIKALRIERVGLENEINEWLSVCDYVLLDAYSSTQYGGTGETISVAVLDYYKERLDFSKIFLAGGLNPKNVFSYVPRYRPYAVDVASGVERAPGHKDCEMMSEFIKNVKDDCLKT